MELFFSLTIVQFLGAKTVYFAQNMSFIIRLKGEMSTGLKTWFSPEVDFKESDKIKNPRSAALWHYLEGSFLAHIPSSFQQIRSVVFDSSCWQTVERSPPPRPNRPLKFIKIHTFLWTNPGSANFDLHQNLMCWGSFVDIRSVVFV